MQNLFVTGGAGFIGSAFVRLVLTEDPMCHMHLSADNIRPQEGVGGLNAAIDVRLGGEINKGVCSDPPPFCLR